MTMKIKILKKSNGLICNIKMGCLCSSKIDSTHKVATRSATFCSTRDYTETSFISNLTMRSFNTEYKLLKTPIGSGLVGEIRLCRQFSTSKVFAVKVVSKASLPVDFAKKRAIENQVKIIQKVNHPGILGFSDFFEDSCSYYLVMDYISGGDLYCKLEKQGKFSEKAAAKVMMQVFSALAYMHSNNIVHRDLKLENVLIEEHEGQMLVKLIDFDTATTLKKGEKIKGKSGTIYYMAPEVINGSYTEKCDIWSAGVILYSLLTQNFPFGGDSDKAIMHNIVSGKMDYSILQQHKASSELLQFLKSLLNANPEKRLSASEAFNHPWILKHCKVPKPLILANTQDKTFKNSLKQALKLWAIKNVVPAKNLSLYHMMFVNIDTNFDGVLSKEELVRYFGQGESARIEKIIEIADWNSNGVLEYYEFLSAFVDERILKKYAGMMLEVLDKDKSGKVLLADLISFLEYQLEGCFGDFDNKDQGKEISYEDIVDIITG